MKRKKLLYVTNRRAWRSWLAKNHDRAPEIWLVYYKKESGKPRIPYNDAVEEALCYGWIDSVLNPVDANRYAQRFSPRRMKSMLSPMNLERVRRLIRAKKMTKHGLAKIAHHLDGATKAGRESSRARLPKDIERALKRDPQTWKNFQKFSASYRRIRVGWIDLARKRPETFKQRLSYFLAQTKKGKQYGMVR